jgi:hypothetical protein
MDRNVKSLRQGVTPPIFRPIGGVTLAGQGNGGPMARAKTLDRPETWGNSKQERDAFAENQRLEGDQDWSQ